MNKYYINKIGDFISNLNISDHDIMIINIRKGPELCTSSINIDLENHNNKK